MQYHKTCYINVQIQDAKYKVLKKKMYICPPEWTFFAPRVHFHRLLSLVVFSN